MKKNILSRITASVMSAVMAFSLLAAAPASVTAQNSSKVYQYDGYSVEYAVRNEWTGNQSVEITLKNTGTKTITGWAMKYDANGEISDLWNGDVYKHDGESYIIRCKNYNSDIAPGRTVSFGYNVSGDSLDIPASFENCMKRVDVSVKDFTAEIVPSQKWDGGFSGNIELSNISDTDITSWELSFTANFFVDDVWNASVLTRSANNCILQSNETTMTISPDGKASIGIRGRNTDGGVPSISDASLSRVVIDGEFSNPDEPVLSDETLFAYGEYDASSDSIILYWMKSVEAAASDVYVSGNGKDFTHSASLADELTYSCDASNHLPDLFFKIAQKSTDGRRIESNVVHMKYDNGGYILFFEDTDEDGLPDLIEDSLGTDRNNADTDKDGLNDYEEYTLIGTDPTKYDTDGNGISDANEDTDNDGLSNRAELDMGTNPASADTDSDGLLDGEEGSYGCDPLKYDTDNDGICDGDEIKAGLNPTNPSTHGVPDNQYTFEQAIPSDSEIFSGINTSENPYRMSIEITSAGYAPNSISAGESGYSAVMTNDAILGVCTELSYKNGCKIENIVLKFEIDSSAQANVLGTYTAMSEEFQGIKRLNVFRYFDDINMLLPIETFHDTATGTVSAHVDELGTYCLMDMEVWLAGIGIEPEESLSVDATDYNNILTQDITVAEAEDVRKGNDALFMPEERLASANGNEFNPVRNDIAIPSSEPIAVDGDVYTYLSTAPISGRNCNVDSDIAYGSDSVSMLTDDPGSTFPKNKKEDIKVVFVVNVSSRMTEDKNNNGKRDYLETIKENIYQASRRIFVESPNATVYIMENRSYPENVRQYYEVDVPLIDLDTGEKLTDTRKQTIEKNSKLVDTCSSAQGVKAALEAINEPYQTGYAYDLIPMEDTYIQLDKMNLTARDGVYIFDYTCSNSYTIMLNARSSVFETSDRVISKGYDMSAISYQSGIWYGIHGYMADETGGILVYQYEGSYVPVLNHIYGYVPEIPMQAILATGLRKVNLAKPLEINGLTDTDNDGLSDWDEVDTESGLITFVNGEIQLPTFAACMSIKGGELFYVEQGLKRYQDEHGGAWYSKLSKQLVLPINSDPTSADGDGDGAADSEDPYPIRYRLNELFIYNAGLAYELAQEYSNKSILSPQKYNNKTAEALVFMLIRYFEIDKDGQHKYCIGHWPGVAGNVDQRFIEYVKQQNEDVYNYFRDTTSISSPKSNDDIDLNHMAATISAILYESDKADGFKEGLMPEKHIDALAGWAGDLQSLVNDSYFDAVADEDHTLTYFFELNLGNNNSRCGQYDLNADADAVNISKTILENEYSLTDVLVQYYNYDIAKRFSLFIENGLKGSKNTITTYASDKYVIYKWPILYDEVTVSSKESELIRDIFWRYMENRAYIEE